MVTFQAAQWTSSFLSTCYLLAKSGPSLFVIVDFLPLHQHHNNSTMSNTDGDTIMDMTMGADAFTKLPRELLDSIASYLPTRDFNNLRLACKHIENLLFPYWANCFFVFRQFMMSEFSLNTLIDISRHPVLSKHMTHLAIGLDDLSSVSIWDPHTKFSTLNDVERYHSYLAAQESLMVTGDAVRLLSTALANLPNLDYVDIRDYSSPTRYRDNSHWTSYGSSTYQHRLHNSANFTPLHPSPDVYSVRGSFITQVYRVVVTALGQASTTRHLQSSVRRLDLILKGHEGLHDAALFLAPSPDLGLRTALEGLTTLHLSLEIDPKIYGLHAAPSTDRPAPRYNFATVHLQRFLTFTPNLTWLRINNSLGFRGRDISRDQAVCAFFSWLALPPGETLDRVGHGYDSWIEKPMLSVMLPQLRRLDLGAWNFPFPVWASLLQKFKNIEHLCLFRCCGWTLTGNMPVFTSTEEEEPMWAKLVRSMSATIPGLKRIELSHLHEGNSPDRQECILFVDQTGTDFPGRRHEKVARDVAGGGGLKAIADSMTFHSVYYEMMENNHSEDDDGDGEDEDNSEDHSEDFDDEVEDSEGDEDS